ncbi:hypothetical protein BMS3Bbin04_02063 [bacterium BMS3Bbin04]|nr:hypothetical protein BMS3Bbin04_02063 [bacterium BMS3Bbin04]
MEVVNRANTYFADEATQLLNPDKMMNAQPHVLDMTDWDLDWVMFFQIEGPRDNLSFTGNVFPRADFYNVILPREYDEFKRGHPSGSILERWVGLGVTEVSLVPFDSTASVFLLEPFTNPNLAAFDAEKRKALIVGSADLGTADKVTISLAPVTDRMERLFNLFAGVLLLLWVIGVWIATVMIVRIRRQNKEIGALSESAP